MIAAVAVGIGIALGPALPVLAGLIGVIKIIGGIVGGLSLFVIPVAVVAAVPEASAASLLSIVPVLGPLLGGAYLLRKAHTISNERQDLSLGLAQAFPALTKASSTNAPARELSQSLLTHTIDAKIAKAEGKLEQFRNNKAGTEDNDVAYYVDRAIEYYDERVNYLKILKNSKETNDSILLLGRLLHRLGKAEDVNERAALDAEIKHSEAKLQRFKQSNGRIVAAKDKDELIGYKEQAPAISTNADFMRNLPVVKNNDVQGRVRFFYQPEDLEYHNNHQAKTKIALTPAAGK